MIPSPPILSSFDPACHLHSEEPTTTTTVNPPSESFSDDLEAIHLARADLTRNKVVIQHRAWNLSDVFRSEDDLGPGMIPLLLELSREIEVLIDVNQIPQQSPFKPPEDLRIH